MTDQLVLIDSHPAWRIDTRTRERGLRGVATARRALKEARKRAGGAEPTSDTDVDSDDHDELAPAA